MTYKHIGSKNQARALAGLPYPKDCACVELSEMRREWCGVFGQELSAGDSSSNSGVMLESEKALSVEGFVVSCHRLSGSVS